MIKQNYKEMQVNRDQLLSAFILILFQVQLLLKKMTVDCTLSVKLNVSQPGCWHVCNLHVAVSVIINTTTYQ